MSACQGSYLGAIRRHPNTGAAECPYCTRRFDSRNLAGDGRNVPLHSPHLSHAELSAGQSVPCAAWHLTFGGRYLNCGYAP